MSVSPSQSLASSRLATLSEYFFAMANERIKAVAAKGINVLNFGMGSPDLAPPPAVVKVLSEQTQNLKNFFYPSYGGLPGFNEALSAWYGREHNIKIDANTMIQPLSGSKEGIFFTTLALVSPGKSVLVPNPGYSTYAKSAAMLDLKVVEYDLKPEHEYFPSIDELEQLDLKDVALMWINYPNNPTGAVASAEQYRELLAFTRKHNIILASDNPYSHVIFSDDKPVSLLEVAEPDDLVIELNSLSKTYNLAGMRLGWAAGHPSLMGPVKTVYSNIETGIYPALQLAGITALETDTTWIKERNAVLADRQHAALELLEALGCTALPTMGSLYLWAELPADVINTQDYCFELLERTGVFVTPGTAFGSNGEGYVRLALCQPVEAFREALDRVKS